MKKIIEYLDIEENDNGVRFSLRNDGTFEVNYEFSKMRIFPRIANVTLRFQSRMGAIRSLNVPSLQDVNEKVLVNYLKAH